jgi:post-segregation antitoxin (ccd killing protein)
LKGCQRRCWRGAGAELPTLARLRGLVFGVDAHSMRIKCDNHFSKGCRMQVLDVSAKKPVNLSLNESLVQESRAYCGNLSAKVEEMLQAYVLSERQARQELRQQEEQQQEQYLLTLNQFLYQSSQQP